MKGKNGSKTGTPTLRGFVLTEEINTAVTAG